MTRHVKMTVPFMLVVFSASCAAAAEWYVDNQAAGSQSGADWANAYTNFAAAVSNVWGAGANSGDTVYIRQAAGAPDYGGGLVIGAGFADGTPEAYNRIVGWSGEGYAARPRIRMSAKGFLVTLGKTNEVSRNYYEFRNLSFYGNDLYNSGSLLLCYQTSNVRFLNNVCTNASFRAADGSNAAKTNLLIQSNLFGSQSVCEFRHAYDVRILDNVVTPNAGTVSAIYLSYICGRVQIQGNRVIGGDCVCAQSASGVTVARNLFKASYRAGIFTDNSPDRWLVCNNIFYGVTGSHASYPNGFGINVFRNPSLKIVNNTFHDFPETGSVAMLLATNVRDAVVFNNIVSGVSTGLVYAAGCTATNDYNAFWDVEVPHTGLALAGPNDRLADPQFADTNSLNFKLGNGALKYSAALSFTSVPAPADDYYGTPRGAAISFGAIESPSGGTQLRVE